MSLSKSSSHDGPPHRPEVRKIVERQKRIFQKPSREEQINGFHGWQERGYLPHRDEVGLTQFVTFRLADSFPAELRAEWEHLFQIEDQRERRLELEAWLDRGRGVCHLQDDRIAQIVAQSLRHFDGERYQLRAFTLMPNHVHVLFQAISVPMAQIVKSWKQFSARQINTLLGRSGSFWQLDYWDTYMRDAEHEAMTIRYIRNNPMKAGLTDDPKSWPWTYVARAYEA